jgi:hypothetical protein
MVREKDAPELLYCGRELLDRLNWTVITTLLAADAARDGDAVAVEVTKRWLARRDDAVMQALSSRSWKDGARLDRAMVFGNGSQVETETAKL